jgi:hypothetical protein
MAATLKSVVPPRSAERQRLADAIERHANAVAQRERVTEAQQRLDGEYFDRLQPTVAEAHEALAEARHGAPHALVEALLADEPAGSSAVAEAEAEFRQAEAKVAEARQARSMLRDELRGREHAADQAKRAVDAAVRAVVSSDPAKQEVLREFFATGRQVLRLARVLRTMGDVVTGISADDIGLHLRIGDIAMPGDPNRCLYTPNPEWLSALAGMSTDADQPLPGLPEPEPEPEPAPAAAAA